MSLSQADLQKIQNHFATTGARSACPACGKNDWIIHGELVAAPGLSLDWAIAAGGRTVPMVQVMCVHCGCVLHFAAKRIGIIP